MAKCWGASLLVHKLCVSCPAARSQKQCMRLCVRAQSSTSVHHHSGFIRHRAAGISTHQVLGHLQPGSSYTFPDHEFPIPPLVRYLVVYRHGGVYADADVVSIKPLDMLINPRDSLIAVLEHECASYEEFLASEFGAYRQVGNLLIVTKLSMLCERVPHALLVPSALHNNGWVGLHAKDFAMAQPAVEQNRPPSMCAVLFQAIPCHNPVARQCGYVGA